MAILGYVSFWAHFFNVVVILSGLLLILIVLIQRGKGGGLAGAFGGTGGSSAFGSRAGDMFTRITIGVAAAWLLLTMVLVIVIQKTGDTTDPLPTGRMTLPSDNE